MFRRPGNGAGRVVATGAIVGAAFLFVSGTTLPARQAQTPAAAGDQAQAALPAGREIVDRHVDAIGGAEAVRGTSSWRAQGSFELPGQGITGTLEVLSARPARSLVTLYVPGFGEVRSGYDGRVAWTIDPASGPSVLSGRALTQAADDARFDAVLHPEGFTSELTTVERTEFDRRPAYKVKVVFASGREQFDYYDVETGLQIGTEGSRETPLGFVPSITYLRNYKAFGPLRQATEIVQQPLGIEQVVRIASIEYDVVPETAFALPPPIQALVKR